MHACLQDVLHATLGPPLSQDEAYPGWAPNPGSAIVKLTADAIGHVTGEDGVLPPRCIAASNCRCGAGTIVELLQDSGAGMSLLLLQCTGRQVCPLCKSMLCLRFMSAGTAPEVKAIHAGLECGIIGEKLPGLDCVSYGPTIRCARRAAS
jgi:dipeptidase D